MQFLEQARGLSVLIPRSRWHCYADRLVRRARPEPLFIRVPFAQSLFWEMS